MVWAASLVNVCQISFSFFRFYQAVLHMKLMWVLKLSWLSIHGPRYFIHLLNGTGSPLMLMISVSYLVSLCLEPMRMNSVLELFICKWFWSIQVLIFYVLSTRSHIASDSSFSLTGSKSLSSAWLSAKPLREMVLSGMTSLIVLEYARYRGWVLHNCLVGQKTPIVLE